MHPTHTVRPLLASLAAGAFLVLVQPSRATAQCLDYADGFTLAGGFGLSGAAADFVMFDDGTGPAVYVGAGIPSPFGNINGIGKLTPTGWQVSGSSFFGSTSALAVFDDGSGPDIYIGGSMGSAGTQTLQRVIKWAGGAFLPVGTSGPDNQVSDLCVHDDGTGPALYACGVFQNVDGLPMSRVAKWNGSTWSALGSGCNGTVNSLASYVNGSQRLLIAGGQFTTAGGVPANRIAAWNGLSWANMGTGIEGPGNPLVSTLHVADIGSGPTLFVGGNFTLAGGAIAQHIARWNGTTWFGIPSFPNQNVSAITSYSDANGPAIYVGGMTQVGSLVCNGVARWNGSTWSALSTGVSPVQVNSLFGASFQGVPALFVSGDFTSAGGKPCSKLAAWGVPCTPPQVLIHPDDKAPEFGDVPAFHIDAGGLHPLTYRWRRQGVDVVEQPGYVTGTTTNTLSLSSWSLDAAGAYDCVVTNALGSATSNPANLTIATRTPNGLPQPILELAAEGDPVQGLAPGAAFVRSFGVSAAADGDAVMYASVRTSPTTTFFSVLRVHAGALTALLSMGDTPPGFPAGSTITAMSRIAVASGGRIALTITCTGPLVTNADNDALLFVDSSGVELVQREGDPVPALPAGTLVWGPQFPAPPQVNDSGVVAFTGFTKLGTVVSSALWTWTRAGGAVLIAKSGDTLPSSVGTVSGFDTTLRINANGTVLFKANLTAPTGFGVWTASGVTLSKIAVAGDPLPSGSVAGVFGNVDAWMLNANDEVLVSSFQVGTTGAERSYYVGTSAGLTTLVPFAATVPGSLSSYPFRPDKVYAFTNAGNVLFDGSYYDSCSGCPVRGLFIGRNSGIETVAWFDLVPPFTTPPTARVTGVANATMDELERVVFTGNYSTTGTGVLGWTQGSGIFPIATPGQQVHYASTGKHGTVSTSAAAYYILGSVTVGITQAIGAGLDVVFESTDTFFNRHTQRADLATLLTLYGACPTVPGSRARQFRLPGEALAIHSTATGALPLSYQWTKDGSDLFDGANVSGSSTADLMLTSLSIADAGEYALRVSNACGSALGPVTVLEVGAGIPYCFGTPYPKCSCTAPPLANGGGCPNSIGAQGQLRAQGNQSLTNDSVVLLGSGMLNSAVLYFQGTLQTVGGLGQGFGDGLLCVTGAIVRLGIEFNIAGASQYPAVGEPPVSVQGLIGAPGTRNYQIWYRDSAAFCTPSTFNLTNGVSVAWVP
ncbi:MAG: hypothetical protein JNL28_01040 [Planctomycetes bacterium]|nr:hypothetical protein [Planctomycetota bacterium]